MLFRSEDKMETLTHCPICNSKNIQKLFKSPDKVSSGELFEISKCLDCTFRFTSTRPTEKEAGKYYQSDKYVSHTDDKKGLVLSLYRSVRKKGVTIRKSNDCLIAYFAISCKAVLLHNDGDFDKIAKHSSLKTLT